MYHLNGHFSCIYVDTPRTDVPGPSECHLTIRLIEPGSEPHLTLLQTRNPNTPYVTPGGSLSDAILRASFGTQHLLFPRFTWSWYALISFIAPPTGAETPRKAPSLPRAVDKTSIHLPQRVRQRRSTIAPVRPFPRRAGNTKLTVSSYPPDSPESGTLVFQVEQLFRCVRYTDYVWEVSPIRTAIRSVSSSTGQHLELHRLLQQTLSPRVRSSKSTWYRPAYTRMFGSAKPAHVPLNRCVTWRENCGTSFIVSPGRLETRNILSSRAPQLPCA